MGRPGPGAMDALRRLLPWVWTAHAGLLAGKWRLTGLISLDWVHHVLLDLLVLRQVSSTWALDLVFLQFIPTGAKEHQFNPSSTWWAFKYLNTTILFPKSAHLEHGCPIPSPFLISLLHSKACPSPALNPIRFSLLCNFTPSVIIKG